MADIGYFLSSEELGPNEQVRWARRAEEVGFERIWISDHYHPWTRAQGQSPFVWGPVGAIAATTSLHITTAVTCPTVRIHPAVLAQAAATAAVMTQGRFAFGLGSGERLNEHVLGDHWPPADIRLEMLEEAVEVMRKLWEGGIVVHQGRHFKVEDAQLFTLPDRAPPVYLSGFGPKATGLAARIADGYINTSPSAELVKQYRDEGGQGPAQAGVKVCWAADEDSARKTAHSLWAHSLAPGEAAQELAMPAHFEALAQLVTPDMVAETIPCGPDPERHLEAIRRYVDAGFDEIYVAQMGDDQEGFLTFYTEEVIPRL